VKFFLVRFSAHYSWSSYYHHWSQLSFILDISSKGDVTLMFI
jgi:hypothetical protein